MKTLKIGDNITIHDLKYKVVGKPYRCWLSNKSCSTNNEKIFNILNIKDGASFVKAIVKYNVSGNFPQVKSLEDLTKVVEALMNYNNPTYQITLKQYQDYIGTVCNSCETKLFNELGKELLNNGVVDVSESLIEAMYEAAQDKHLVILDELFPKFNDGLITGDDLEVGEVMEVISSIHIRWIMRTYDRFIDLREPNMTWGKYPLKGKRIEIEITKK